MIPTYILHPQQCLEHKRERSLKLDRCVTFSTAKCNQVGLKDITQRCLKGNFSPSRSGIFDLRFLSFFFFFHPSSLDLISDFYRISSSSSSSSRELEGEETYAEVGRSVVLIPLDHIATFFLPQVNECLIRIKSFYPFITQVERKIWQTSAIFPPVQL